MSYLTVLFCMLLAAGPADKQESESVYLVEEGFSRFLEHSGLADSRSYRMAEVPCGEKVCIQFILSHIERKTLLKHALELAGGFGLGADVTKLRLTTSGQDRTRMEAAISVLPHNRVPSKTASRRSGILIRFFRFAGSLNEGVSGFDPSSTRASEPVYFLLQLAYEPKAKRVAGLLAAPPKAPIPQSPQTTSCFKATFKKGRSIQKGEFAGWRKIELLWERVCKD